MIIQCMNLLTIRNKQSTALPLNRGFFMPLIHDPIHQKRIVLTLDHINEIGLIRQHIHDTEPVHPTKARYPVHVSERFIFLIVQATDIVCCLTMKIKAPESMRVTVNR